MPVSNPSRLASIILVPLLTAQVLSVAFLDPDRSTQTGSIIAIGFFLGSCFSHATLAAAWTAFGPGPLRLRFLGSAFWMVALTLAIGVNVYVNGGPNDGAVVIGSCLFGQWLILALAFTALSACMGLCLQASTTNEGEYQAVQVRFGIRDLMIAMTGAAILFGIGRVAAPYIAVSGRGDWGVIIMLAVAAVIMTFPLLLAALIDRWSLVGVCVALALIVIATYVELPLLKSMNQSGPQFGHFVAINTSIAITILCVTAKLRSCGYRLVLVKKESCGH